MNANLARVEHLETEDVERMRWARADSLGEARDADSHQLAARALLGLLATQISITDLRHRQLERRLVVAAVVRPARRRPIRELLGTYEVLQPEVRGIDVQLVRGNVGEALDGVHCLGDAERAAIGNAAGWLVRVSGIDGNVRGLHVVRPG